MTRSDIARAAILLTLTTLASGCATRQFVREQILEANHRTDTLESRTETQIEHLQTRVDDTDARVDEHDQAIDATSETARHALQRAVEAGKLAEGKLLYETTFSSDHLGFEFEQSKLGDDAQLALDELATRLKEENQNIYLEIQGHTDSSGPETYNFKLGEDRAEAVSRYLNMQHGLPLHRMSTISYGESAPAADNGTREGRSQNRRVVVVVLR